MLAKIRRRKGYCTVKWRIYLSRLRASDQFHVWCVGVFRINIGFRNICDRKWWEQLKVFVWKGSFEFFCRLNGIVLESENCLSREIKSEDFSEMFETLPHLCLSVCVYPNEQSKSTYLCNTTRQKDRLIHRSKFGSCNYTTWGNMHRWWCVLQ